MEATSIRVERHIEERQIEGENVTRQMSWRQRRESTANNAAYCDQRSAKAAKCDRKNHELGQKSRARAKKRDEFLIFFALL